MLDKVLNLLLYCVSNNDKISLNLQFQKLCTSNLFFKTPFDGNYFYVKKNIQGKQLAVSVVFRHGNETLQNCPGNL